MRIIIIEVDEAGGEHENTVADSGYQAPDDEVKLAEAREVLGRGGMLIDGNEGVKELPDPESGQEA